jgi:hypothetical protein
MSDCTTTRSGITFRFCPPWITVADVDNYWSAFCLVTPAQRKGNGALYSALASAVERFKTDLDNEKQERFRSDLDAFIRAYSFLSQIVTWTDNDLEKLYVWAKSLLSNLPKRPNDGSLDLGAEVELTHLRIEKAAELDVKTSRRCGASDDQQTPGGCSRAIGVPVGVAQPGNG